MSLIELGVGVSFTEMSSRLRVSSLLCVVGLVPLEIFDFALLRLAVPLLHRHVVELRATQRVSNLYQISTNGAALQYGTVAQLPCIRFRSLSFLKWFAFVPKAVHL
jgi:hypothetical protein